MNELSSRRLSLSQQRHVNGGLADKDPGTTHVTMTSDAMTRLDLTPKFDVTYLPRKIEELIEQTEKPLHRAILKNYLRHALLEISGYWEQILAPELTVPEPIYRVAERGQVHVLVGQAAVKAFYRRVAETKTNVIAARTLNMCVGDFGVVTEAVWSHMTPAALIQPGELEAVSDPEAYYLISHNILQNFAYTHDARLIGERVYDDPASYQYEKLEPVDVVTPEMARAQLTPFLARATLD
jgi:hypothetical protein